MKWMLVITICLTRTAKMLFLVRKERSLRQTQGNLWAHSANATVINFQEAKANILARRKKLVI